ncbi:deoxynucleoside kinase [Desulfurivibrio sp. D14AmB]|uniref:deoxynucleoside kinase n=1 Tax=Desulfurivibrio sp. D14AmB TaxID=3374370 RepID=UPI00376EAB12
MRTEICGNIASGKTTLCGHFSFLDFLAIYESFSTNPFLTAFYSDPARFSFETEITFLLQHYHAIKTATETKNKVCDFSIILDKAYADVTLQQRHRDIFLTVAEEVDRELGLSQTIIHLQCPEEVLLERIASRNRDFEKNITIDYLRQLTEAIKARVDEAAKRSRVITVNSHEINFVDGLDAIPHVAALCGELSVR